MPIRGYFQEVKCLWTFDVTRGNDKSAYIRPQRISDQFVGTALRFMFLFPMDPTCKKVLDLSILMYWIPMRNIFADLKVIINLRYEYGWFNFKSFQTFANWENWEWSDKKHCWKYCSQTQSLIYRVRFTTVLNFVQQTKDIQSFSERHSIERRSERALITSEREIERRSNSHWRALSASAK